MSVSCTIDYGLVDYSDAPTGPQEPYVFEALPRIGETVVLRANPGKALLPRFRVIDISHVPEGVENGLATATILKVQSLK